MDLKGIAVFQREFDGNHLRHWNWMDTENEGERLENLQYGALCLAGEVGEFANEVKKILREYRSFKRSPTEEQLSKLREELADVFIYLIKLSDQVLKMNLEEEYLKKMNKNKERFKIYEREKV